MAPNIQSKRKVSEGESEAVELACSDSLNIKDTDSSSTVVFKCEAPKSSTFSILWVASKPKTQASFLAYSHQDTLSVELTKVKGDLTGASDSTDALSAKIIKVKSDLVGASDSVDHLARELKVVQEDLEKEQGKTSTVYTRIQELEDNLNKLIKKSKVDNINLLYETELHKTCDVKLATFKAQITKLEEKLALLILNDTIACKWSSRANSLP
ncbi:hypothetical protein QYF36_018493 [Acer negundo]|nr:hypothetical protein QYF36_018493 [Acer negundo]